MFPTKRRSADMSALSGSISVWLWLGGVWLVLLLLGLVVLFGIYWALALLPFAAVIAYRIAKRDNKLVRNWFLGCLGVGIFFAAQGTWPLVQQGDWQASVLADIWWGSFVFWGFQITVFMGSLTAITSLVRRLRAAREE